VSGTEQKSIRISPANSGIWLPVSGRSSHTHIVGLPAAGLSEGARGLGDQWRPMIADL